MLIICSTIRMYELKDIVSFITKLFKYLIKYVMLESLF